MAITQCGRLLKQPVTTLPDFLVPAFQVIPHTTRRSFASSAPRTSRVGAAPIALPPEVNLRLLDPPKRRGAVTRVEPPKTIEIEGPLGRMLSLQLFISTSNKSLGKASVQLPPFVSYSIDDAAKKATLSVMDKKSRDQRELWGWSTIPLTTSNNRC